MGKVKNQITELLQSDEALEYIKTLLAYGYSQNEIAEILNISPSTISKIKQKHQEVAKAFYYAKVQALKKFLESAKKKLEGEKVVEERTTEIYRVRDGEPVLFRIEKVRQERYIPPDTSFMQFWARNIFKDLFADEQKLMVEGTTKFIEVEKVYVQGQEGKDSDNRKDI